MNKKTQYRVLIQTDGNNEQIYYPQQLNKETGEYESFLIDALHVLVCSTMEAAKANISKKKEELKEKAAQELYLKNRKIIIKEEYEYIE